jgi:hypothetical protein
MACSTDRYAATFVVIKVGSVGRLKLHHRQPILQRAKHPFRTPARLRGSGRRNGSRVEQRN